MPENSTYTTTNLRSIGHWQRNYENQFSAHIFVKSGSIYVKPRTKWSAAHSPHIFIYISPAKMLRFCDICL